MRQYLTFQATRLICFQIAMVFLGAFVCLACFGISGFYSALIGGLGYALPHLFFAKIFFKNPVASRAPRILLTFYMGEILKLMFNAALIAICIRYFGIQLFSYFIGLMTTLVSAWFSAPFWFSKQVASS